MDMPRRGDGLLSRARVSPRDHNAALTFPAISLSSYQARLATGRGLGYSLTVADNSNSLIRTFDYVWDRTLTRFDGLSDHEYFWEPVPDCWTLRQGSDGKWTLDGEGGGGPAPDPVPITTIAWRICHLGGLAVGGFAVMRFGAHLTEEAKTFPATADGVNTFLAANFRAWRDALGNLDEEGWNAQLGPSWGEYADDNTFDLVLHVLDEVVHHAAEVGLLRDLYSQRARDCTSMGVEWTTATT